MKPRSIVLSLLFLAAVAHPANAQKDVTVEGQVKVGVHKFKLDNKSLYQIEVTAKDFSPSVTMSGLFFLQNTADFFKEKNTFRAIFAPPKSEEHTVTIMPQLGFGAPIPEGLLDYKVTLKTMKLDETPVLKKDEKLTATDPKYANPQDFGGGRKHHKSYPIKMKAGQIYLIDMVKKDVAGNMIDPYLYLEDAKKAILSRDDDGGGFPNARIMFRATADGEYTIIATALGDALGDYTITVRTTKAEK
jgi:hypothetical protein